MDLERVVGTIFSDIRITKVSEVPLIIIIIIIIIIINCKWGFTQ
jgi:hypothetical protein